MQYQDAITELGDRLAMRGNNDTRRDGLGVVRQRTRNFVADLRIQITSRFVSQDDGWAMN